MPKDADFLSLLWDSDLQQLLLLACPDGIIVSAADGRVLLYTRMPRRFEKAPDLYPIVYEY